MEQGLAHTISEKAGAALKGLSNVPADAARYPLRGAVWLANKYKLLSDAEAENAKKAINHSADNPVYISDDYNKFLNAMEDKHPNTATVAEVAGDITTGAALAKGATSFVKNVAGKIDLAKTPKKVLNIPIPVPKKYKHTWNNKGPLVQGGAAGLAAAIAEESLEADNYQ